MYSSIFVLQADLQLRLPAYPAIGKLCSLAPLAAERRLPADAPCSGANRSLCKLQLCQQAADLCKLSRMTHERCICSNRAAVSYEACRSTFLRFLVLVLAALRGQHGRLCRPLTA